MAEFERHFAGVPTEAQRLPRAPVGQLSDTGQTFEAQALAQAGSALTDTAATLFKWNEREGNSEYDTSRGFGKSLIGEFERTGYADSTDFDAGVKKLEADLLKVPKNNNLKNKSGIRKYKEWLGLNKAARKKITAEKRIRMIEQNNQAALFNNLTNVAKDYTDTAEAKARIKTLIAGGLDDGTIRTASQAIAMEDKANANWLRADVWRRATSDVRPDGEVDWSQAAKWFDNPENIKGLPEEIVEDFAGTALTRANAQRAQDTIKIETQRTEDRQALLDKLISEDFIGMEGVVNATALSPEEKLRWIEKSESRAAAINSGKNDPMNQTSPSKYFELRRKIETKPGSVIEADLAAAVGQGISISDYNTLLTMVKDKDNPLNTPQAKRGQTVIDRIRSLTQQQIKAGEKGFADLDPRQQELGFLALQNELDRWIIETKPTDAELEKKVRSLTEPVVEEVTLGFLDRVITGFFRAGKGKFDRALVDKKIDELKDRGIWKTLEPEDKESVQKAFERDVTVQQIIDNL